MFACLRETGGHLGEDGVTWVVAGAMIALSGRMRLITLAYGPISRILALAFIPANPTSS